MNLTKKDMDILEKVYNYLPSGEDFDALPEQDKQIIVAYDALLVDLVKRRKKANKNTAEYIADKRKANKNYARGKGYIKIADRD